MVVQIAVPAKYVAVEVGSSAEAIRRATALGGHIEECDNEPVFGACSLCSELITDPEGCSCPGETHA